VKCWHVLLLKEVALPESICKRLYLCGVQKAFRYIMLMFVCLPLAGWAANYTYDYNSNCSRAYQCYMSLHIQEGDVALYKELKANPYNLMATYLSDYHDCIVLLMNADKGDYDQWRSHYDERLDLLDKGNENSPWYRFCKAGIYLHWALVHIRFGEQYKAAITFRKSYVLLKDNQKQFPNFEYNSVFAGLEEAVAGTVPDSYKWLASIFGVRGDVKKGIEKLSVFVQTHTEQQLLTTEATLYEAYLKFYLQFQQKQVWDYLNSVHFSTQDNLLNAFVKSNIAVNYRKADATIEILKQASTDKNYSKYPVFDYQMGNALLSKCDASCIGYYQRFIKNDKGLNYMKDALQKLSFIYYLQGNMQQANYYRAQVPVQGIALVDADKQAERACKTHTWPPVKLLQARLLIDGGYYDRALSTLASINEKELADQADKNEYTFRLGRVYEEEGKTDKALTYYRTTITNGKERHEHFAARAALQAGMMYERNGMKPQAISSYKEALNMRDHDFQNSIDQQAKAGINRLSN